MKTNYIKMRYAILVSFILLLSFSQAKAMGSVDMNEQQTTPETFASLNQTDATDKVKGLIQNQVSRMEKGLQEQNKVIITQL